MNQLPNIWGGGQLFAFSGLEGETSWEHPIVGSLLPDAVGIDFHQNPAVVLEVSSSTPSEIEPEYVLGDVFSLKMGEAPVLVACVDRFTVIGRLGAGLTVHLRDGDDQVETKAGQFSLVRGDAGANWALAFDPTSADAARDRATAALASDVEQVAATRRAFIESLGVSNLLPPADSRTYRKAASVLKTNVMSPEGSIERRWTTPDRWPHRHMWLWDSAFHSLGWLYLDPQMAKDALEAMVESAYPDGMIPLCSAPTPTPYDTSQPPLLAWAVWEVHQATADMEFPVRLYDGLAAYIRWFLKNRDRNNNGLYEWLKNEEDTLCHCGESGLDNSPRFDQCGIDDHVDLCCMLYNEMEVLSKMAVICDRFDEALQWKTQAAELARLVNERMWDEETGFYYDLRADGTHLPLKTVVGFLPLWAGIATREQARRLMAHYMDPREFASEFPVPTVAMDEPSFSDDMWRGPAWINMNYLIFRGLLHYGLVAEANDLRARTLKEIQRWYEETGAIYEYYDNFGKTEPGLLHRKGGVGKTGGYGIGTIRDYGWSAALYVALANECVE
ncbi:MAG: amylo-alpha-1,6-glucosidase [Armatimonadota bacterium]